MGDSELMKAMGRRIMLRRRALKMTQEELSEKLGVSTQMISNLELGKKAIRPENLVRLCSILKISADFVLTGSNTQTAVDSVSEKLLLLTPTELKIIHDMLDYMIHR